MFSTPLLFKEGLGVVDNLPLLEGGRGDLPFVYKPLKATQFKPFRKNEQEGVWGRYF